MLYNEILNHVVSFFAKTLKSHRQLFLSALVAIAEHRSLRYAILRQKLEKKRSTLGYFEVFLSVLKPCLERWSWKCSGVYIGVTRTLFSFWICFPGSEPIAMFFADRTWLVISEPALTFWTFDQTSISWSSYVWTQPKLPRTVTRSLQTFMNDFWGQ